MTRMPNSFVRTFIALSDTYSTQIEPLAELAFGGAH